MKREIKFRGKRVDNGQWVYGYYVLQPENKDHFAIHWILTGNDNLFYGSGTCRETFEKYEVIPESVGEYTGLKDDNGKEIYEGDIVQKWHYNEKEWVATVEHIDYIDSLMDDYRGKNVSGFYLTNPEWDYPNEEFCDIDVIGNIFENPELLK